MEAWERVKANRSCTIALKRKKILTRVRLRLFYAALVTFSGFDPELLGQLGKSAASPIQTYLLQRVIRSIDSDALLSQYAVALAGMASELPRAQSALLSHSEKLQPRSGLLAALCRNAETSVAKAREFRPNEPILNAFAAELATVPTAVIQIRNPEWRKTAANHLAVRLDELIQGLPSLFASIFNEAWSMSGATP